MSLLNADIEQRLEEIGEDTVDLFVLIQESFGIEFVEDDGIVGKRVREIADCISTKSNTTSVEGCLCAATFYLLRREFCSSLNTPRALIRPSTSLAKLLPWASRKSDWRGLQERTDLNLPSLTLNGWVLLASLSAAVIAVKLLLIAATVKIGWHVSWFVVGLLLLAVWMGMLSAFEPLARSFPAGCENMGDLVRLTAARNYSLLSSRFCGSSRQEMILLLRQLIATQVGIGTDKITPETRIPQDLNIF